MKTLLLLLFIMTASTKEIVVPLFNGAAPDIEFRELAWWAPNQFGEYGWRPDNDETPVKAAMGRIEKKRILGAQEIVWKHRFYPIENVTTDPPGNYYVIFPEGKIVLSKVDKRSWQVLYEPRDKTLPTLSFRTFTREATRNYVISP